MPVASRCLPCSSSIVCCSTLPHPTEACLKGFLGLAFLAAGTAPAAPVFLFLLGVFSGDPAKPWTATVVRGLKLIALGYVLNALRFGGPILLGSGFNLQAAGPMLTAYLAEVDILQVAGLSMILLATVSRLPARPWVLGGLVLGIPVVSPWLWGLGGNHPVWNLLWGTNEQTSFPFFPWVLYPLLGAWARDRLLSPGGWARPAVLVPALVAVVLGAEALLAEILPVGDYFRSGIGLHLVIGGFVVLWLGAWIKLGTWSWWSESRPARFLEFASRQVTAIYVVQWVLFGWLTLVPGLVGSSDGVAALVGLGVLIITFALVRWTPIPGWFTWFQR